MASALVMILGACGSQAAPDQSLTFRDVTSDVGLDASHSAFRWEMTMDPVAMMGGGVCWIDVDNDGWLDLFVTDSWSNGEWGRWTADGGLPTSRLYRNDRGIFTDVTSQLGAGYAVRGTGCVAADLDNDGFTDLYVTTERENLLLWNDGGNAFSEGAQAAGVQAYGWAAGAAAGDINGDGLTDLIVTGYVDLNNPRGDAQTGFPNTFAPISDWVFVNQGTPIDAAAPRFEAVEAGLEPDGFEYGLGAVLTDFDGDGDLDLHVANDTQPNRLYRNESTVDQVRFADISATSGTDDPHSGMGIASADLNADMVPDLVVTNLAGQGHAVLTSEDSGYIVSEDAIYRRGLDATGWGVSFGDFDNDGDQDLLIASGAIPIVSLEESAESIAYLANEDGLFVDATSVVGLNELEARNGRAIAVADYDNDGDLDAVASAIGHPLTLLQNQQVGGDWLTVDPGTPTAGLRARLTFESGLVVERVQHVGGSWLSSEDPRLHFGLPDDDQIGLLEVWGPGGTLRYEGVPGRSSVIFTP